MSIGLKDTPSTPGTSTVEPEPTLPDKDADYIELGVFIKKHIQAGDQAEDQSKGLGRQTTVHRWYAGAALKIVQDRETRERRWVEWCRVHGFNLGTCYEAIRLFTRSGSVEKVRNLSITDARKTYQTNKRSFTPPGAQPQPKKIAAKVAPKITYQETEPLKQLRAGIERVVEAVTEVDGEEWKHADPEMYVSQIDGLMEKLRQAKQAILGAQRAARAELKAKPKVVADANVVKGSGAAKRTKAAKA